MNALSDRVVPALLVAYLIFLIIFGIRYHVMEVPASSEWDGYALKIDELRSRTLPHDFLDVISSDEHVTVYRVIDTGGL